MRGKKEPLTDSSAPHSFNPEKDILFIPLLESQDFMQSVEDLSLCRKKEVRKFLYLYLTAGREYLKRSIRNTYRYHGAVRDIFNGSGMPEELSFLPLLESGFEPYAVSRSGATGLWQFMRSTAIRLGMKIDGWTDERRHFEKSTRAAIRHLRNLHDTFGTWELALAAYNGGAGHVKRAMQKSRTDDFWTLASSGALRPESSEFVPRFAALLIIYKNQELFGISDEVGCGDDITLQTDIVNFEGRVNLHELGKALGTSPASLRRLNPELNTDMTPYHYRQYALRLPAGAAEKIASAGFTAQAPRMRSHVVKQGECVTAIAEKYKTQATLIVKFNGLKNPDSLQAGRVLFIPY